MAKRAFTPREPKWPGWPNQVSDPGFFYLFEQLKIRGVDRLFFRYSQFISSDEDLLEDFLDWDMGGHPDDAINNEKMQAFTPQLDAEHIMLMHVLWAHEMYFSRMVENFIIYLQDVIAAIYRQDPTLIELDRKVDFREVTSSNLNDFYRRCGHEKLQNLSRGGISELSKEINRLLHGPLSARETKNLKLIVEMRNALVHRRGIGPNLIDSIRRKRRKPQPMANLEVLGVINPVTEDLYKLFVKIDSVAIKRYGLPTSARAEIFANSPDIPDMSTWT